MEKNGVLPVELSTIIIPFYTQALVKMGLRKNPLTGEKKISLDEAKNIIDIIDFLKKKTEGNLTEDEEQLIDSTLTQLKTEYLKQKQIIK
jgi:hypothetical protein